MTSHVFRNHAVHNKAPEFKCDRCGIKIAGDQKGPWKYAPEHGGPIYPEDCDLTIVEMIMKE